MSSADKRKHEIMKALQVIARNSSVKVCLEESVKGAMVCGTYSFIGGMLLGPVGLAIGGALGGLVAYNNSNEFLPLHQALGRLTDAEKQRVINHVEKALTDITPLDLLEVLIRLYKFSFEMQKKIKNMIIQTIIKHLRDFLKVQMCYA